VPSAVETNVTLTAPAGVPAAVAVGAVVGATVGAVVAAAPPHAATRKAATKEMPAIFLIHYSQNSHRATTNPVLLGVTSPNATPDQAI
jgi:hypothetical protein